MCQRETNTVESIPVVGRIVQLSEKERLQEIDTRIGARLIEKELFRAEYMRGFWDCFYILALIAWAGYLFWYWKQAE